MLHWNNEVATRRLLESLAHLAAPAHRVYVVDNGSTDGSTDRLEPDFPGATWIRNGANLGFSGGCNVGMRRALADGADYVLLLNNDCIVSDPNFLAAMVAAAGRDPRIGLVGCKMMRWPDTARIWSTGGHISGWRQSYIGDGEIDRGQYARSAPRRFISGAVMLIPRRTIERVGLLPEEYFFGHEDWEYSVRVHQAGLVLWYEASATVQHESSHSHDVTDAYYVYNDLLSRMLFQKRVLPGAMFALWRAAYGVYLDFALPLLRVVRPRRYLPGFPAEKLEWCMREALRDVEWIDRITPAMLERFRARSGAPATRPLRVAQVLGTSGLSGVESYMKVLVTGLRAEGIESSVLCKEAGPLTEWLDARGFEVRLVTPRGRIGLLELPRLARAIKDADVVHSHGPRQLWWVAALGLVGATPPRVGTVHQFDVSGLGSAWKRTLFHAVERWALRMHGEVIAVSRALRERTIAATGIPPERVHWVPNSAPILLDPPQVLAPPNDPRRVVVLARLVPEKCVGTVLAAWADPRLAARPVVLRILGDGPLRAELEAQARALGLGARAEFLGSRADALAHVEGALALVSPGRVEPFGIAALEAMTLGVPVIATDAVGHRDVLGDEFKEWMIPAEDPPALAAALARLLALTEAERAALGERLSRRARGTFGPERSARETARVYRRALGHAGAAVPAPEIG